MMTEAVMSLVPLLVSRGSEAMRHSRLTCIYIYIYITFNENVPDIFVSCFAVLINRREGT